MAHNLLVKSFPSFFLPGIGMPHRVSDGLHQHLRMHVGTKVCTATAGKTLQGWVAQTERERAIATEIQGTGNKGYIEHFRPQVLSKLRLVKQGSVAASLYFNPKKYPEITFISVRPVINRRSLTYTNQQGVFGVSLSIGGLLAGDVASVYPKALRGAVSFCEGWISTFKPDAAAPGRGYTFLNDYVSLPKNDIVYYANRPETNHTTPAVALQHTGRIAQLKGYGTADMNNRLCALRVPQKPDYTDESKQKAGQSTFFKGKQLIYTALNNKN